MDKLIYSGSPHIRAKHTTRSIMGDVCIALIPAVVASIIFFGLNSLLMIALSVIGAVGSEIVYCLIDKKPMKKIMREFDLTSVVTGLLLALNMPPFSALTYFYIPLLSAVFAVIVVKMLFGGTGCNFVNPAISGRIFALMSFTLVMTQSYSAPLVGGLYGDVISTGATPLTAVLTGSAGSGELYNMGLSNLDLFLGTGVMGSIGETSKAALLLGLIYLMLRKVVNPFYPIVYIATTGLFTVALNGFNFAHFLPSILSGGLFLGAIFMATDYVTSPNTKLGNYIYFFLLGLVTAGLRAACKMEVVSFAIMLLNLIVPMMDKFIVPKPFGYVKRKTEVKK